MATWPPENPSSNSKGGLLASLALARGITNFSTLPWQAQVEVLLANLLQNDPPGLVPSLLLNTITDLGTNQSSTPTAAQLLGGILKQTSAVGAGTITTPTGAVLSAACPTVPSAGYTFQAVFLNVGGGQALTVTAGASGMTVRGTAAIPSAKSAILTFVCTAADAWDCWVTLSA